MQIEIQLWIVKLHPEGREQYWIVTNMWGGNVTYNTSPAVPPVIQQEEERGGFNYS